VRSNEGTDYDHEPEKNPGGGSTGRSIPNKASTDCDPDTGGGAAIVGVETENSKTLTSDVTLGTCCACGVEKWVGATPKDLEVHCRAGTA